MWKGEHGGSKRTLGFALDYHSKDFMVVIASRRDEENLQRAPWFNQALQAGAHLVHRHRRALNG
jgi:hypothetical protein